MDDRTKDTLAKLKVIRSKTDLKLRETKHLKKTFTDFAGRERDLVVRYYQVQGILHLVVMKRFVLGDDTGLGKCKTLKSLILSDRGLLRIGDFAPKGEDLQPDTFYPLDQPFKVWTGWGWASVKSYYHCGVKPIKVVRTRRGYETDGSLVHPLWVRRPGGEGFFQMQDLVPGDYVCLDRSEATFPAIDPMLPVPSPKDFQTQANIYPVPDHLTPDLARLLGYIVAEGWTKNRYHISITQHKDLNPETHDDIRHLCNQLFGGVGGNAANKDTAINLSSVYLRNYFQGLGIGFDLSAAKSVPWPIFQGTSESVRGFLQAFFDSEGSINGDVLDVSSASEMMLREVQTLLLRFGIMSSRNFKKVKAYPDKTYWRLAICGQDAVVFHEKIGLLTPRKMKALGEMCGKRRNANLDVVPYAKNDVQALWHEIMQRMTTAGSNANRKGSGIKQFGTSFEKTLNNIRNVGCNPTYAFLNQMLENARLVGADRTLAYAKVLDICTNRFFYDPIKTIMDGQEPVADIEVDDHRHSFVADGFVNHNTLQTIAALCYVWEKEPDRKVIIMTTKSATKQWVDEFSKFAKGVSVITCQGSAAQREAARQMYVKSTGPTVMVMGYRSAVQDFRKMQPWTGFILVADECFQYHTPVILADGTTELIGKIVTQRMPVEVLSWNPDTGHVEPKRVVHWHRNALGTGHRKNLLSMSFRFGGNVRVTRAHKFYAPDECERPAGKLRKGSEVQHLCMDIPSEAQWQVVLGALLGDSCISHPKRPRWGVAFGHSEQQGEYLQFKRGMLATLGVSEVDTTPNKGFHRKDGKEKGYARFCLNANEAVTAFLLGARVHRDGKKRVTLDWLDRIGPLGLAVWYADDGTINEHTCLDGKVTRRITLNTQGFTREEVELIAGWLRWKWGVNAEVKVSKPRRDRPEGQQRAYPYLYMVSGVADRFLDILPCGFPGVMYKFPNKPVASLTSFDLMPKRGIITDWVTGKRVWTPTDPDKDKYVYDMEVEGNHNYFANGSLVSNCTAFKNPSTQVHQVCRHLGEQADRVWALTATLIKNHLMEGYGIYQVVMPGLFGMSKNQFMMYYCLTRMQSIGSSRQIPVIVGYLPDRIAEFREVIDAYFIGRPKHEVASELPTLTTKTVEVELNTQQATKYAEALAGLLAVGRDDNVTEKEVTKLSAISYCQEIVNHLDLINCDGDSPKLNALIDMLVEGGDFEDEKVIVFTRFEKLVTLIMARLKKEKISAVRVTGKEDGVQRQAAMKAFQDPESPVRIICITTAGSEAINLQAAKALVCFDTPWSAGDFIQLVGRMLRIGSTHDRCFVVHLLGRLGRSKTIDHRVMEVLGKKMELVEAVLGKRIKGEDDNTVIKVENDLTNLFKSLREDAQGLNEPKVGQ